jgi:hypothetical protein
MTKPRFKSDAFEAIHSSVRAMFKVGAIDEATMRHFDESCLLAPVHIERAQPAGLDRTQWNSGLPRSQGSEEKG